MKATNHTYERAAESLLYRIQIPMVVDVLGDARIGSVSSKMASKTILKDENVYKGAAVMTERVFDSDKVM